MSEDESTEGVMDKYRDFFDAGALFLLSAFSVFSAYVFPLGLESFLNLDFSGILSFKSISALFFVLPVVYTGFISTKGFRKVSFVSLIGFSGVLLGSFPGAVGVTVAVSCLVVSWRFSKKFTGENYLSVFYSSGGVFATFLAVFLSVSLAFSLVYVPGNSEVFRDSVEQSLASQAEGVLDTVLGSVLEDQGGVEDMVSQVSTASAMMAVQETQFIIFDRVRSSEEFGQQQLTVLEGGFQDAVSEVPPKVSNNVSETFSGSNVSDVPDESLEGSLEPAVEEVVGQGFERKKMVFGGVFLLVFSVLMLLRLPFKLVSMFYGGFLRFFTSEK